MAREIEMKRDRENLKKKSYESRTNFTYIEQRRNDLEIVELSFLEISRNLDF